MMPTPWKRRQEHGAALIVSLLVVAVLLVVGSGSLTTSRIETQMASYDLRLRQAHLAAEYALTLGESTVEQALNEVDLASRLAGLAGRLYDKKQQPPWSQCVWDDRDSIDVSAYFQPPHATLPATLPLLPLPFRDAHDRPRFMIERKWSLDDSLAAPKTYGARAGITYVNVSAHGARARWTAVGDGQPDDRPGLTTSPPPAYHERYPGTRVVLQSLYAKRYK